MHPFFKYIPASLWALFILFATIANVSTLESLQLGDFFAYDKPIHMALFGIQAFLMIAARLKDPYLSYIRVVLTCCLISAVYGAFTEVLQGFLTTTRSFDYLDMIADVAGCMVVYVWFRLNRNGR